jgi:hypothetical protein
MSSNAEGWADNNYRTIDFGEVEQTINDAQYAWVCENAVSMDAINNQKYTIKHGTLSAIGDAIRGKLNTETKYDPVDMPQAIEEIGSGTENLPNGYLKVNPTWKNFSNLCNARPEIAVNLKYSDTANGTHFISFCQAISTALGQFSIPSLDLRKAETLQNAFLYSDGIVEIGNMDVPNVTDFRVAFNGCTKLQRITFAPSCIKVAIGFPSSNLLDDASIQSIIDGLADLTEQETQTLTFHADVGAKLTDQQKLDISSRNWTLAY